MYNCMEFVNLTTESEVIHYLNDKHILYYLINIDKYRLIVVLCADNLLKIDGKQWKIEDTSILKT